MFYCRKFLITSVELPQSARPCLLPTLTDLAGQGKISLSLLSQTLQRDISPASRGKCTGIFPVCLQTWRAGPLFEFPTLYTCRCVEKFPCTRISLCKCGGGDTCSSLPPSALVVARGRCICKWDPQLADIPHVRAWKPGTSIDISGM